MIAPEWRRICGLFCQSDGVLAAVWIAHDPDVDVCHLYDTAVLNREPIAMIAECIAPASGKPKGRAKWIPIAWASDAKEVVEALLDRGLNTLPEAAKDTVLANEMNAISIQERMRTSRFKVDKRLGSWLDEMKTFTRQDAKMPREGYPLMAATQCAMSQLEYARRQQARKKGMKNYPKVAIV